MLTGYGKSVPRRAIAPPASYIAAGAWPEATLRPDAPIAAHVAQQLARGLRDAMAEHGYSQRKVADLINGAPGDGVRLAHTTLGRVLTGAVYIDGASLASIEAALQTTLWPGWQRHAPAGGQRAKR